ncbi:hypothetical protein SALBM311S_05763 [Streptomyces alboniger]
MRRARGATTAEEELKSAATALSKLGAVETSILHVGEGTVDPTVHGGAS